MTENGWEEVVVSGSSCENLGHEWRVAGRESIDSLLGSTPHGLTGGSLVGSSLESGEPKHDYQFLCLALGTQSLGTVKNWH